VQLQKKFYACGGLSSEAPKFGPPHTPKPSSAPGTTSKNTTAYTSSRKLLNKSAMHAVISLLLQSRKFWWYLCYRWQQYDAIMTSCSSIEEVRVSGNDFCVPAGQRTRTPRSVRACCVKKRQTFLRPTCVLCGLRDLGCHAASCSLKTNP